MNRAGGGGEKLGWKELRNVNERLRKAGKGALGRPLARLHSSPYLVGTRDIDLVFKPMPSCLLADRFQLNQGAGGCRVRKGWQEWKSQDAGRGRRREGGTEDMGFIVTAVQGITQPE